jgi:hypothetical protein
MNPYDAPEPERRGMSGTSKVLLGLGIGCGVLVLLCCGALGVGSFALYRFAQKSVIEDPARIEEIQDEIVSIQIPEAFQPKLAIDARMPFTGEMLMRGVVYTVPDEEKGVMLLGEVNGKYAGSTDDLERQLKESMSGQQHRDRDDFEVLESEKLETKIHDEDAEFQIAKGKKRKSKKEFWEATGRFRGDGGPALLFLRAATADFTKEQVLEVIKSMK